MTSSKLLATLALALAASAGTTTLTESSAHADVRIRIGGSAHVRVGGGVRVRGPRVHYRVRRPPPPPLRIHVGGSIWVGGGYNRPRFAAPPPAPEYCDCGPSEQNYYPVMPTASGSAYLAPAPRPALPRWGIGLAAGGVSVEDQDAGDDLALVGRFRLTPGLLLEGEIGKNELANDARVDRRLGASLIYEIGAYNRWAPYFVGGAGVSQVEVGDGDFQSSQSFGEVGVGLRLAVTARIHVGADIRAGSRSEMSDEARPLDAAARSVAPPEDESEEYTRARISGVLYF